MCGIVGLVVQDGAVDRCTLERMRDTMVHRGPDACGTWRSEDGRVAFGHRRLSILDLSSAGLQPMPDDAGELHITFNGEIYNFRELAGVLESSGHGFRTGTDTEVLLAAYRQWGTDCPRHLVGMFSFAIHDARRRLVFCARDRAGEKPLFYRHDAGRLQFASELKALLAQEDFERRIDREALHMYLACGFVPGDRTLLHGVRKLPAAHAMTYEPDSDRLEVWRYWDVPAPAGTAADPEELEAELLELLEQAVRSQLVADVPVGLLLSGGVDSSLVTAVAARVSAEPVRTFTVSFPGHGSHNESAHARLIADHFGTRHTEVVAEPATVDLLPLLAAQYDEPIADSSMVPTYLVSRAIREQVTVALGGDGADELFGGYEPYSWILQQERARRYLPGPMRAAAGAAARRWLPVGLRGRNYVLGYTGDLSRSLAYIRMFVDAPARSRLVGPPAAGDVTPEALLGGAHPLGTAVQRLTGTDFRTYLTDDILVKVDRAAMLASLEVRAPFLDHRIIEFAFGRVPDEQKVTRRRRKILLRSLSARLLHAGVDSSRKQGFSVPLGEWFRGEWGGLFREVLLDPGSELFDTGEVRALIAGQERGLANTERLFSLTMLELWRREYGVAVP
jgi:asparagine synthase (glutamine-hydrolysing)